MKKISVLFAALLAISLVGFGFVSCSDDDDDGGPSGGSSATATLPANVGTNEFSGKTWTLSSGSSSVTLAFTDSTLKWTDTKGSSTNVDNFKYTYNSTEKLLYLAYTSRIMGTTTVNSVSDYVNYVKSMTTAAGGTWTSGMNEYHTAAGTARFKTPVIFSYSIDGTSLKLSGYKYFDGTLPTEAEFEKSLDSGYIEIGGSGIIKMMISGTKYYSWPTYSNGSFSGKLFNSDKYTVIGTISGTYTTSGKGLTGSTVTLKFASLPSTISGVSTNTEYVLSQQGGSSYATFTQQ